MRPSKQNKLQKGDTPKETDSRMRRQPTGERRHQRQNGKNRKIDKTQEKQAKRLKIRRHQRQLQQTKKL